MPGAPPLTRNLAAAQAAYDTGDRVASRAAHGGAPGVPIPAPAEAGHAPTSPFWAALSWGVLEGGIAGGVVLIGGLGAGLPPSTLPRLLAATLLPLCAGVGCRDGLRYASSCDVYTHEKARETWELSQFPEGETAEMVELYSKRGLGPLHAAEVVQRLAEHPEFFVDGA